MNKIERKLCFGIKSFKESSELSDGTTISKSTSSVTIEELKTRIEIKR